MIGIYKIISPSGKIYIGKSKNIEKRFAGYKSYGCKTQPKLNASFLKYGVKNHIFSIVEECNIDNLSIKENYYILVYDSISGLNCKTDKFDLLPARINKKKTKKSLLYQRTKRLNFIIKMNELTKYFTTCTI